MAAKDDHGQGGTVYLLCFAHSPYKAQTGQRTHFAAHYLGATGMPLEDRLAAHRGIRLHEGDKGTGRPAKLVAALLAAGGDCVLADVWETSTRAEAFALEKRLKKQGSRSRICSICSPGNRRGSWAVGRRPKEG